MALLRNKQESVSDDVQGLAVSVIFFFSMLVGEAAPALIGAFDPRDERVGRLMAGAMVLSYSTSGVLFFVLATMLDDDSRTTRACGLPSREESDKAGGEHDDDDVVGLPSAKPGIASTRAMFAPENDHQPQPQGQPRRSPPTPRLTRG